MFEKNRDIISGFLDRSSLCLRVCGEETNWWRPRPLLLLKFIVVVRVVQLLFLSQLLGFFNIGERGMREG